MKTTLIETKKSKILVAHVPETVEDLVPLLDNLNTYTSEFNQLNAPKRKKEFIAVRILMNILLGKSVIVTYDNNHKPYLTLSDLSISISHSGDYLAIMVTRDGDAGIDIECRTTRVRRVCKRYLTPSELAFTNNPTDTSALEIAWSAKEAIYKCIGKGANNFHTIKLSPFVADRKGIFEAVFEPTGQRFKLEYVQNETYTLVYCE
jgi:4'-phosphopantetheinyl transferase